MWDNFQFTTRLSGPVICGKIVPKVFRRKKFGTCTPRCSCRQKCFWKETRSSRLRFLFHSKLKGHRTREVATFASDVDPLAPAVFCTICYKRPGFLLQARATDSVVWAFPFPKVTRRVRPSTRRARRGCCPGLGCRRSGWARARRCAPPDPAPPAPRSAETTRDALQTRTQRDLEAEFI